jgi:CheY-like chemotaxis protein
MKFTDAGSVRVDVFPRDGMVCFAVRDQGIGIPADKLPHLFEKFSQVDGSATRRFGGTGLGLAISRQLALLMGGDIGVDSREGEGSTFSLTLPLNRAANDSALAGEPVATPLPPDRRLRILAAEDNETNRLVLQAMLAGVDADLVLVEDGAAAVRAFAASGFDLVLMDVQMPVMNGLDATRAIRAQERREGKAPTPIIALTANAMRHQIEEYEAAGMDIHVSKPLQVERLFEALALALEGPRSAGTSAACAASRLADA